MNSNNDFKVSAETWNKQGSNLLRIQPFLDSIIVDAEGSYLIDADGHRILDMAAGQFCAILGYKHPEFVRRLQQQVSKLIHIPNQYVSSEVLQAAERLAVISPGDLNHVIFLSTGSEANECILRIAKTVTGKTGTLALSRGYHGISLATRNLSSISEYPWKTDFQPWLPYAYKMITPTCSSCPLNLDAADCDARCLDLSLEIIGERISEIGIIILETVVSAGGMIFLPQTFLQKISDLSKEIGALLVIDEAQTGFGRCGRWFDIENYGLVPDALVVSKTAGNGYPASAVILSDRVAQKLERGAFTHLSSHQNDPLAAVAVQAVIDIVEREGLAQQAKIKGVYLLDALKNLKTQHSCIKEVRGRGLMVGMEMDWEAFGDGIGAFHLAMLCERYGLHITFSYFENVIRFLPALIIKKEEIDFAVDVLHRVLLEMERGDVEPRSLLPRNRRNLEFIDRLNGRKGIGDLLAKIYNTSPRIWKLKARDIFQRSIPKAT